jgi:hypothetical protein
MTESFFFKTRCETIFVTVWLTVQVILVLQLNATDFKKKIYERVCEKSLLRKKTIFHYDQSGLRTEY